MGLDLERKTNLSPAHQVLPASNANTISSKDAQERARDLGISAPADERIEPGNCEIDFVGCADSGGCGISNTESDGATDNSSSFGNSISGNEDSSFLSDTEVESQIDGGDLSGFLFDGRLPLRKKKLTDQWRRFIHPLMWRCKWIELHLNEFKSQELKYGREFKMRRQRKLSDSRRFTFGTVDSKSLPFSGQNRDNKVMTRIKRRAVEETADVASFISQHKLFSYFASKKSNPQSATMMDNFGNPVAGGYGSIILSDELSIEFSDDPLEHIFWKIDVVQAQIQSLKSRVDKIDSENPRRFSSINRLATLSPDDALAGSGNTPSPGNGDRVLPFRFTQSSSHIEVMPLSDILRSLDQHQSGGACESSEEILIQNQAAEEELRSFEGTSSQQAENTGRVVGKDKGVIIAEADSPIDALKILVPTPKSKGPKKRKKGRRNFSTALPTTQSMQTGGAASSGSSSILASARFHPLASLPLVTA